MWQSPSQLRTDICIDYCDLVLTLSELSSEPKVLIPSGRLCNLGDVYIWIWIFFSSEYNFAIPFVE